MKKALLLVAILLLLAGAGAYFVEIEAPELGAAVLARARRATRLSLQASSSRFSLRSGLTLEGVEASSSFPGGRYRVSMKAIVLGGRPWLPWTGGLKLSEVSLIEPRIEITLGLPEITPPSPVPESAPPEEQTRPTEAPESGGGPIIPIPLEVEVTEVKISDATLVLRDRRREQNRLSLSGLDLRFSDLGHDRRALTLIHGLTAHGPFSIANLNLETTEFGDVAGELAVERGRFTLDSLALTTSLGRFEGHVSLDFNVIPFRYRVSLESASATIPGVGSGTLELTADGFGTDSRNMSGDGGLDLTEGEFPSSPLRVAIENALGIDLASRGRATIGFRLENDRIHLERAGLVAGETNLDFEGWIGIEGPIDLTVRTEDGRRVHLTGTLDAPEVE